MTRRHPHLAAAVPKPVFGGIAVELVKKGERLAPRAAEVAHPGECPLIRCVILTLQISQRQDHPVELAYRATAHRFEIGILQASDRVLQVDVGYLVSNGKLQGVVFVFTDQIKQPPVHIDVSAWVRERVDLGAFHDFEAIANVLANERREKRFGGLFQTLSPRPVGRDRIEPSNHVMELCAQLLLVGDAETGDDPSFAVISG